MADAMRTVLCLFLAVSGFCAQSEFRPFFNGRDLSEFIVDTPGIWQVRDGMLVGRHMGLSYNEFLRTRQHYKNFVMKARFQLVNGKGNSGIQFRSKPVPKSHEVSGYQADVGEKYWASLYDESRRNKTLAGPPADFLSKLDTGAWHSYVITVNGPHIKLEFDGVTTVDYTETDPNIEPSGFIALQVHANEEPVEVRFKDMQIKVLP